MKKVPAQLTLAVLLLAAPALQADDFYSDLLQRGVSDSLRGAWANAANELRIAAFGSMSDMKQYATAQVYLAIASDKLGRTEDARSAASKALQAERISPVYATAPIDAATRQAFEQLVPKLLTPDRYAGLPPFSRGRTTVAQTVPQPMPQPQPVNRPTPPPAPAPRVFVVPMPAPQPVPQRVTPVPAPQPQPQRVPPPAPQPVPQPQAAPQPQPQPVPAQPATTRSPLAAAARRTPSQSTDFPARVAEAQRLLNEGKMIAARQAFLAIARAPDAPRAALLEAAKGLSQTDAWSDSTAVYAKLFPLQKGEEPHYFYEAVNRFELGEVTTARDFLKRALPYVSNSREVANYRGRIEGTVQ